MSFWWLNFRHTWNRSYGFQSKRWIFNIFLRDFPWINIHLIPQNGFLSSVPYLGMWISSLFLSMMADWFISTNRLSITSTRKILNCIGQFGPAICLAVVSYTGCNRVLTVFLLTIGISLNGGIYSGFKVGSWKIITYNQTSKFCLLFLRSIIWTFHHALPEFSWR